jgi:putative ABC transport system substrate-binding protein
LLIHVDALFNDGAGQSQIIALAGQHRLPTMMANATFPARGGLISYGADTGDLNRQAGVYVARILRGEKPADLPVVQPTNFALRVNLKTAKALGLSIPESFLLLADEVIELDGASSSRCSAARRLRGRSEQGRSTRQGSAG